MKLAINLAINAVQVLLLVLVAPLVRGVIAQLKARIQNRHGASVWRPYAELLKLFRKEDLVPDSASLVFRLAPMVLFPATLVAAAFVPLLHGSALLDAGRRFHASGLSAGAGAFLPDAGSDGWRQFLRRHGSQPRSPGFDFG